MSNELIVVRQLPVIEDKLREIKASVEARVSETLCLDCTEDTRRSVKEARATLNKEFGLLESRRKAVKAAIMAPYEQFEAVYKECAGDIYKKADLQLKARIDEVESGLRQQKADEIIAYFDEYRESLNIESGFVAFSQAGISVTISESKKSLKAKVKAFLDRIAGDLSAISTMEHRDEILVEYRRTLNLPEAITTVDLRIKAVEDERKHRTVVAEHEAARASAEKKVEAIVAEAEDIPTPPQAVSTPSVVASEADSKLYSTSFTVTGTISQIRALKHFLIDGGYNYEQL